MKCQRKTASGNRCKANALRGGKFCFQHAPESAAAAHAARKLGGYRSATPHAGNLEAVNGTPRTIVDAFTILDYALAETLALDNGIQRGRLLVSIAAAYVDAVKVGDLEAQLKELLSILGSRPDPNKT